MSYDNLPDYAEHIRREMGPLMAGLCRDLGPNAPATLKVLQLLGEAEDIVQVHKMAAEAADPNRYNLDDLPIPVPGDAPPEWERDGD